MGDSVAGALSAAPIARTTLRDEAEKRIRAEIVTGALEAGRIHQIPELAARLGVSITPVREALLALSQDGLVEVMRNRGFRIAQLSDSDLDDIVELRILLEVAALQKLAGSVTGAQLQTLSEMAAAIDAAAESGDLNAFLQADRDFHLRLLELAGNQRLVDTVAKLRDQTRLVGLPNLVGSKHLTRTSNEHAELLRALKSGDAERVGRIVTQHLRHARGLWANRPERV